MPTPARPLFKDPENLLIGVLLAVFISGVGRHVGPRTAFWDAVAMTIGEILIIGLMGAALGWVVKGVRSLWAQPPEQEVQQSVVDLPPPIPTTCGSCGHRLRPQSHFCAQCSASVEQ